VAGAWTCAASLFDVMLAHALIEPELRHSLEYLAEAFLGYTPASAAKSGQAQTELSLLPGRTPSRPWSTRWRRLTWRGGWGGCSSRC